MVTRTGLMGSVANATAANCVEVVRGMVGGIIDLTLTGHFGVSTSGTAVVGIGENTALEIATGKLINYGPNLSPATNGDLRALHCFLKKPVPLGSHVYNWIESSPQATSITFYGDGGVAQLQSGLAGVIDT